MVRRDGVVAVRHVVDRLADDPLQSVQHRLRPPIAEGRLKKLLADRLAAGEQIPLLDERLIGPSKIIQDPGRCDHNRSVVRQEHHPLGLVGRIVMLLGVVPVQSAENPAFASQWNADHRAVSLGLSDPAPWCKAPLTLDVADDDPRSA